MSTNVSADTVTDTRTARLVMVMSLTALLLSGWSVLDDLDDARHDRAVDARLACLEMPGPNDCGLDEP